MGKYTSSGRWSRPATVSQIRALKSHGAYDGKYYSMGRASQAIGQGTGSSDSGSAFARPSVRRRPLPQLLEPDAGAFELLSGLLGIPNTTDDILAEALERVSPVRSSQTTQAPVSSVAFTVREAEAADGEPTVVFNATVTRDTKHSDDPVVTLLFESNVEFSDHARESGSFESGVSFDG